MKLALLLVAVLFTGISHAQLPDRINKKMGSNPVFFLDSIETTSDVIANLNALEISNVAIVSKKKAKKLLGHKAADGAVYITTIKFARENYWKFLCSISEPYKQLIASPAADSMVLYELNGKLLNDRTAPADLFLINNKSFKSLLIKDGSCLVNSVSCFPRHHYVVVIKAKPPKGVIKMSTYKN